jgi:hypothetical protein
MEWPSDWADGFQRTSPAGLSGDEGQPRWKAARWKRRTAVSGFQLFGRCTEERDEPAEALIEGFSRGLAEGVEEGRRRARELRGAIQRVLGENRLDTKDESIGLSPPNRGILLYGIHQNGDACPVLIRGEISPASGLGARELMKVDARKVVGESVVVR